MAGGKGVVPVVAWGPQALDGAMTGDHLTAGRLTGLIGVEAAVDRVATCNEGRGPRRDGLPAPAASNSPVRPTRCCAG